MGHGCEGAEGLFSKFRRCEITEFASHLARVEKKTEIGWRNTGCDFGGFLLHIVWNQPMMFFSAELSEVSPDVQRFETEEPSIFLRCWLAQSPRRPVQPKRNWNATRPEHKNRKRS